MIKNNVWEKSQNVFLKVADDIKPGFDIGFDDRIPESVKDEMRSFVGWVEENYKIPVTLYVDFEYNHYLFTKDKKQVGFLFYWADFKNYPVFDNKEDIPAIRLPVRTERSSIDEILGSFIEAITYYYAWICDELNDEFEVDCGMVDEVLDKYRNIK